VCLYMFGECFLVVDIYTQSHIDTRSYTQSFQQEQGDTHIHVPYPAPAPSQTRKWCQRGARPVHSSGGRGSLCACMYMCG
jgi:hypothetical protein